MKRSAALGVFALVVLLQLAGIAHADSISMSGAQLAGGSNVVFGAGCGGCSFSWGLHSDDPHDGASVRDAGHGSTSPDLPFAHTFAGESVDNSAFLASDHALSTNTHVDIAPSGDIGGKINHVHIDARTDAGAFNHHVAAGAVNTTFSFFGGIPNEETFIYTAYDWRITTDVVAAPGESIGMDFGLNFGGGADPGGSVNPSADGWRSTYGDGSLSGSFFGPGAFLLGEGNWRSGAGSRTIQFMFDLVNGAGSSNPGGDAALDVWFEFSSTPFTSMPDLEPVHGSPVPEPGTCMQILSGLGLVAGAVRRRRLL